MVREYYVDEITGISEQELRPLCQIIEPPACLLGGWAVHLHVNDRFYAEYRRGYIGSRDIDIGFHVNPEWDRERLMTAPVGRSVEQVLDEGYIPLSFRFVRYYDRETGETLPEDEAMALPSYRVFDLYLDVIPDTDDLDTFHDVLGFRPPSEPLLGHVFANDAAAPLTSIQSWNLPDNILIVDADLLASMKIRSIPDRNREQKRVKDVADLHALLWYVRDYKEMKALVRSWVTDDDLAALQNHVDESIYDEAAELLQIDEQLVRDSIEQLIQ